jgi:probable F420-dependent oxidoreductase
MDVNSFSWRPSLKVGVIFPQTECGTDVAAITEFVRGVEAMGFDHLFVADHVLGADPRFHPHPSLATYSHEAVVHEALTLMAYLAAITSRLTLATGILILPQRQTALVAKQAAEIDVLSGGRLRLGIGVGWNAVEFEALNETFENRGRRSAEQIALLRALWTQQVVDFRGKFHRISHAGINPMPIQRPIPIWFGVGSRDQPVPPDAALKRIGRLADGWSPNFAPDTQGQALVARVHHYAREAGRDPAQLPLEGRIRLAGHSPDGWVKQVEAWKALGATFVIAEARGAGLSFPDEHLAALRRFKATVG